MRKLSVALVLTLACVSCVVAVATAAEPSSGQPGTGAAGGAKYPACSPYLSEGSATICKFDLLHLKIDTSCGFGPRNGSCGGSAISGDYPWGRDGAGRDPRVYTGWKPSGSGDGRTLEVVTYKQPNSGIQISNLVGFVPRSNSAEYTVTDAIAGNELGLPNGDHFYTPNLPGQGPGDPGGPLYLNWDSHTARADVEIHGYLYLKR